MRIDIIKFTCDEKGCGRIKFLEFEEDDPYIDLPAGWLEMQWGGGVKHFCSSLCSLKFMETGQGNQPSKE